MRTWISILASAMAVAVLAVLIVSSRSASVQDFNLHYQKLSTVDQSMANYESLLDQLAAARRDGRQTGSGVSLMRSRLAANRDTVTRSVNTEEADEYWNAFDSELKTVLALSAQAEAQQNTIGNSLQQIRDNGPQDVQRLKAFGYEVESQNFYRLLLKVITLGTPANKSGPEEVMAMIAALKQNDKLLSTSVVGMIDAMDRVMHTRAQSDQTWNQLSASSFGMAATNLRNSFSSTHAARMRRVENSRILLSIYSVLLFGGLGILGYRLQSSYQEINEVNEQLIDYNDGLEKRVAERTQELESAFDDLKESQVQLVQAEKMSSLGQLVAGISHEINTPLLYLQSNQTLIMETLARVDDFINLCHDRLIPRAMPTEDKEVVRKRYVKGLQELKNTLIEQEIKEELTEIKTLTTDNIEGLDELTQMAQGLKDFSRLDRAPIENFNVNDGIKRTLTIAKNILKHRVQVIQNLNDVPLVACSPSQINQIFLNLITNAAQAMEDGGDITITTSFDKGFVSVAVQDTGCGIPHDIMAKIRDPFFTTKEVGTGTGLGLSIVEEILGSHNGRLDIQSEVGVGSVFTVLLPHKVVADNAATSTRVFNQVFAADDNVVALTG